MKKGIKIGLKIASVCLLFALVLSCGSRNRSGSGTIYLQREQFVADFTEISNIVKNRYSLLESKQINADSLFQVYLRYVEAAESFDEYRTLLLRYFAELRNSHTGLILRPLYRIDAAGILIENRVFIDRVGYSLASVGINVKDEIIAVEGVPVLKWIDEQQRYVSASTDNSRLHGAMRRIFWSHLSGTRTLLLNTQSGEKEVTLSFAGNLAWSPVDNLEAHAINDYIGYIEIRSMTGNDIFGIPMRTSVVSEFRREFEKLRTKPTLIIDVRRNDGGNSIISENIVKSLIREEQRASVAGRRLRPRSNHYEGNLIVLIGARTGSAAESFVLDLKESGVATLIGSETTGCTGLRPQEFTTTFGTSFRFPTKANHLSPQGFPMEGVGIPPHIFVYQTVEDYLNGIDTVLEFAINFASQQ